MRDDSIKFPKTRYAEILTEKPEKPHVVIATLETRGTRGISLPEILEDMRKKAKEIGADGIIPTQDVSEYQGSTFIYHPSLGAYLIPGGKVPVVRGYAIVYKSTIQRLKRSGYNFRQRQRPSRVESLLMLRLSFLAATDLAGGSVKTKYDLSVSTSDLKYRMASMETALKKVSWN